ncbi:MAG TPA: GNAT family N-acetyltransferase [Candidatus Baltobacteraceae bacterium]|nr:GNAT family N-acetyltransferase [Candidatus Baltobacteraceae bacterium]
MTPVSVQNAGTLWTVLQQPDLRSYQELPNVGAAAFTDMVSKRPKVLRAGTSGRFEWLVYVNRIRKPVGWVSLRIAERDLQTGEIGYSIVRDFRGRGIAREAVCALMDEAFTQGGLVRVNAYCLPENMPSRRLLERLGFSSEGVLPRGATVNGHIVDVLMHRMERARWAQSGNSMVIPASAYPA